MIHLVLILIICILMIIIGSMNVNNSTSQKSLKTKYTRFNLPLNRYPFIGSYMSDTYAINNEKLDRIATQRNPFIYQYYSGARYFDLPLLVNCKSIQTGPLTYSCSDTGHEVKNISTDNFIINDNDFKELLDISKTQKNIIVIDIQVYGTWTQNNVIIVKDTLKSAFGSNSYFITSDNIETITFGIEWFVRNKFYNIFIIRDEDDDLFSNIDLKNTTKCFPKTTSCGDSCMSYNLKNTFWTSFINNINIQFNSYIKQREDRIRSYKINKIFALPTFDFSKLISIKRLKKWTSPEDNKGKDINNVNFCSGRDNIYTTLTAVSSGNINEGVSKHIQKFNLIPNVIYFADINEPLLSLKSYLEKFADNNVNNPNSFLFQSINNIPPILLDNQTKIVRVEIKTANVTYAGTDNNVYITIGGRKFLLDKNMYDDFERGKEDLYEIGKFSKNIASGKIFVSSTSAGGRVFDQWRLESIKVYWGYQLVKNLRPNRWFTPSNNTLTI